VRRSIDHRLARVRRRERLFQVAAGPQPGDGQRLFEALPERRRGARARAAELAGQDLEAFERGGVVIECPRGAQPPLDGRAVAFGQVLEHVALLWRTQRCTGVWMLSTSRTAFLSAVAPSRTQTTPCSTSRPRSTRLASSVVATVAFSVEPSHSRADA
jgi:hypothetical protein